MNKFRLEKELKIIEIEDSLKAADSFYIAEYGSLRVSDLEDLRKRVKAVKGEVKVYKNRLLKIASEAVGFPKLADFLTGQNIFIFSKEEGSQVAKILYDFANQNQNFQLKAGIWEGVIIDAAGVVDVAKLPTYEEALARLSSSLIAPLQNLSLALKLFSETK